MYVRYLYVTYIYKKGGIMNNKINISIPNELIKNEQKYWESKVSNDFMKTTVPFKRVETKACTIKELSYFVSEDISNKILKLCNNSSENIYAYMYSIVTVLLFKYSNYKKVAVETNILKQDNISNIINKRIPIIQDIKEGLSFKEILVAARENIREAYEHANYPIHKIYDLVSDEENTGESPLTDILLILEGLHQVFDNEPLSSKVKITVSIQGKFICLNVEFNKELYSEYYVHMLLDHLNNILTSVCNDINVQMSEISIIGSYEKQKLLTEYNNTEFTYSKNKTIQELFEEQVLKTPDNVAVVFDGNSLTYRELNEKANELAFTLRCKGVKTEVLVGIMLERSENMIIAILAVLKSGGAYLPIDPDYPDERINHMLEDSKTNILITNSSLKYKLKKNYEILYIEDKKIYSKNKCNLGNYSSSKDLAYVIYTSGSTGKSKGVMVEHVGINNLRNTYVNKLKVTDKDKIILFASVSFDASIWEYTMALLNGAQLHVMPKNIINNSDYFIEYLNRNEITVVTIPPEYLAMLDSNKLKTLRLLITAGSAISKKLLDKWSQKVKYINAYGPTETTICSTVWEYVDSISENQVVPIGKPIYNFKSYILDENNQVVPIGVPGELCVSGDGLARGYLNNKDLTNQKFIENPYEKGKRIYKTGDLAKWLPDGNIEFLGRIDHQVKIRGYRIELSEIENAILNIEGISEVKVIDIKKDNGKYLCAYIVSAYEYTSNEMREHLLKKLPEYMIPGKILSLQRLPINQNGKVDRKALEEIEKEHDNVKVYKESNNDYEEILVDVWKNVLGKEEISVLDDFFYLGGDSIKAIQVSSILDERNLRMTITDIIKYRNIESLAKIISINDQVVDQGIVTGNIKLSPIQTWFFKESKFKKEHFYQSAMLKSTIKLNRDAVKEIFYKIQEHHDMLRTCFTLNDDEIKQEILDLSYPLNFNVIDMYNKCEIEEIVRDEVRKLENSFTFNSGTMMNVTLFQTESEDYIYIMIHHLVVDTVSWNIIIKDIDTLLRQYLNGEEYCLPKKTNSMKQWVEELYSYANSREFLEEKEYWEKICNEKFNSIPFDFNYSSNIVKNTEEITFTLNSEETSILLKKSTNKYNVEFLDILLSTLSSTIYDWTSNHKFVIMLEGHGRENLFEKINVNRTVGWFTSLYPMVIEVPESNHILDVLKETKKIRNNIINNGIGYNILRYITEDKYKEDVKWNLESPIAFNYHGEISKGNEDGILTLIDNVDANNISSDSERQFALEFNSKIYNGQLKVSLVYNKEAYKAENVNKIVETYKSKLYQIINLTEEKLEINKMRLKKYLKEYIDTNDLPGMIVGIQSGNSDIEVYSVGKADIYNNIDMDNTTRFKIGSITKTFTAAIILQLVEEKVININDSIIKYIPELSKKFTHIKLEDITIKKLLNHFSGIYDYTKNDEFLRDFLSQPYKVWEQEELVYYGLSKTSQTLMDSDSWLYSSTGYILLGMIIERVTQISLKDNIETRISDKLGLENTILIHEIDDNENFSRCYASDKKDMTSIGLSGGWAAGGMISTANDLLIWINALIDGKFVNNSNIMFRLEDISKYYPENNIIKVGLGVFEINNALGHEGHGPGFQNALFRKNGINIMVHINRGLSNNDAFFCEAREIADYITESLI
ncbi:hypothetical protein COI54_18720 [Bacillus wiedmannii]|nr:hypothetical protein COI54_18720 [Bacillus wiedmannii]